MALENIKNTAWRLRKKVRKAKAKILRPMIIHSEKTRPQKELKYSQKSPFSRYVRARKSMAWKRRYSEYAQYQPIEKKWVLYESHFGIGMVCNPYAIFKAFQRDELFEDFVHIWVIDDERELIRLKKEYKDFKNVKFVRYGSVGYAYFLAKSKYLINNTSFATCFHKREGQVFLNTWHSITVKSLGYDTPDGPRIIKNMLRSMIVSDYIISPNEFMTDIYDNAFRLRDIADNVKYIEEGYPRNDLLLNADKQEVLDKLSKRGTKVQKDKKIILYAPTWTGNNAGAPIIDMSKYDELYEHLSKNIDMNEYQILIKPHPVVYRRLSLKERRSGKYVSYCIDANELLGIVDILITDYSSIYFDYMMSNKPILFYIPDYEKYSEIRGIYFKLDELPGPCCKTLSELSEGINNLDGVIESSKENYEKTLSWACKYDNGKVSEKIIDILFKGNLNYNIKKPHRSEKTRILFFIGNLATNGVTSAALSLLNKMDYSKYDVSVFVISLKSLDQNINFDKIPDKARTLLRVSVPALTISEQEIYNKMLKNGIPKEKEEFDALKRIMENEYIRIFGGAKFDHIIDFYGYSPLFQTLISLGNNDPDVKRYMWQHSDMFKDLNNAEKMRLNQNSITIDALKSCYNHVHKIVSSTKDVLIANKANLAIPETENKFTYATNLMDEKRLEKLLSDDGVEVFPDRIEYSIEQKDGAKEKCCIKLDSEQIKFVTMGRCMPEKNHANIIRAIKRLNDEGKNAAIYIIGDGHLRESLQNLAENLGISDKVLITGVLQNPMALLKRCDCFLFPSYYEAQGLAVLEARVAKLPIIVSNYDAVGSVLIEDKQYVLKTNDADGIYDGMIAFINGEIPSDYEFSIDEYNKRGIAEFKALLGEE